MALYVGCLAYLTVRFSALFNDDDYADSALMTILNKHQNTQLNRQDTLNRVLFHIACI